MSAAPFAPDLERSDEGLLVVPSDYHRHPRERDYVEWARLLEFVFSERAELRATLAEAVGTPVTWEQNQWVQRVQNGSCGTGCCVAGAAILATTPQAFLSQPGRRQVLETAQASVLAVAGIIAPVDPEVDLNLDWRDLADKGVKVYNYSTVRVLMARCREHEWSPFYDQLAPSSRLIRYEATTSVSMIAAWVLGLDATEEQALFAGGNTPADIAEEMYRAAHKSGPDHADRFIAACADRGIDAEEYTP